MSDKPEADKSESAVKQGVIRIAGAVGGIVIGALVGGIGMAIATMLADTYPYLSGLPSPTEGAFLGGGVGLLLGLIFPEKLAFTLAWLIAS